MHKTNENLTVCSITCDAFIKYFHWWNKQKRCMLARLIHLQIVSTVKCAHCARYMKQFTHFEEVDAFAVEKSVFSLENGILLRSQHFEWKITFWCENVCSSEKYRARVKEKIMEPERVIEWVKGEKSENGNMGFINHNETFHMLMQRKLYKTRCKTISDFTATKEIYQFWPLFHCFDQNVVLQRQWRGRRRRWEQWKPKTTNVHQNNKVKNDYTKVLTFSM